MAQKRSGRVGAESTGVKMRADTLARKIEQHKRAIAKHRDALRDLIHDAEAVIESADRANEALQTAVDALSEYV